MTHPYRAQPARAFWRGAGAPGWLDELYRPRVCIGRTTRVATAGSCFAQAVGAALRGAGCAVLDAEPAPSTMPDCVARRHGYGLYSGRYGNIYGARQMRQLLEEVAHGAADARLVWTDGGVVRDALRPRIEPEGFGSVAEAMLHRDLHLERVSRMLRRAEVFVFTLGLTETWEDRATGRALPVCPGVAGGRYDPARHVLRRFGVAEVVSDLRAILAVLRRFAPGMEMIVTVSPVPLAATATRDHVLAASVASKAVLRAAAAEFVVGAEGVDYAPAFEIVTQGAAGGPYFAPGLREVSAEGVAAVMDVVLGAHGLAPEAPLAVEAAEEDADPACEERLLEAFAR